MNNLNKYSKDLVTVIITLGHFLSGGETVFYDGVRHIDLGKIAHLLKNLCGRKIIDPFERCFHEGSLWTLHIEILSFILTKQFFCTSFFMGIDFITDI